MINSLHSILFLSFTKMKPNTPSQSHTAKHIFAQEAFLFMNNSCTKLKFHILDMFLILVQQALKGRFQQSQSIKTAEIVVIRNLTFHIFSIMILVEPSHIQEPYIIIGSSLIAIRDVIVKMCHTLVSLPNN